MRMIVARRIGGRLLLAGGLLVMAACDGRESGPGEEVAGDYEATTWTVTEDGEVHDLLAEGGEVSMTLLANGSMSATVFIPSEHAGLSGERHVLLAGPFLHDAVAGTVRIPVSHSSYLPGPLWTVGDDRLSASSDVLVATGRAASLVVVLER